MRNRTRTLISLLGLGRFAIAGIAMTAVTATAMTGCAHQAVVAKRPSPVIHVSAAAPHVVATEIGFEVSEEIEFAKNSAELSPRYEGLLTEVATVLKDNPELLTVYLAGFASNEGDPARNQQLSTERASAVRGWLVAHGVDEKRLPIGGFGVADPVGDNDSKVGRRMNRRVELIALKYIVNGAVVLGSAPVILKETVVDETAHR